MGDNLKELFSGKSILVTGGTGSIGREIVRQLLQYDPEKIGIFGRNEYSLYLMTQRFREDQDKLKFFIGDVRDKERLEFAVKDMDFVFHAAALKHVPMCEFNPFEAVKTNVVGTQNLIEACLGDIGVGKVILISTDKAVEAINVMGATKLLAEHLFSAANSLRREGDPVFSSVRFGNVLGSKGSVIPTFINQLVNENVITITEPQMTRFFMSTRQAVSLVFKACGMVRGGEVFILKMPVMRVVDIAEILIEEYNRLNGGVNVSIEHIGIRPGEKICEELVASAEVRFLRDMEDMFILDRNEAHDGKVPPQYISSTQEPISKDELHEILLNEGIIDLLKYLHAVRSIKTARHSITFENLLESYNHF
ncbi:MAG: SDR family NAD(P)-dependent oxidoreductase [bacterium]